MSCLYFGLALPYMDVNSFKIKAETLDWLNRKVIVWSPDHCAGLQSWQNNRKQSKL